MLLLQKFSLARALNNLLILADTTVRATRVQKIRNFIKLATEIELQTNSIVRAKLKTARVD